MFNDTLELRALTNSPGFELFDFPYNLYDNNLKKQWEQLFIQYFEFHEIGFESQGRFKRRLKNKLDMIYPYYKEYYKTTLQVETEEFMITKDLLETYERIIEGENISTGNSSQSSNLTNNDNSNGTSKTTSDNDNINTSTNVITDTKIVSNTPKGRIENLENYMSNAEKNNNNSTNTSSDKTTNTGENILSNTSTSESVGTITGKDDNISKNNVIEKTSFHSKGDLGVSSSGLLIEGWRSVITNINQMMFDELEELFISVL